MAHLAATHLDDQRSLQILDLGSYDVNGSYRPIFDRPYWHYRGVDLSPGPNVDIVLSSPYRFPMSTHSIDLIISGQAFEHIEFFWRTWLEMVRVLKPGGIIFLIAPSRGPDAWADEGRPRGAPAQERSRYCKRDDRCPVHATLRKNAFVPAPIRSAIGITLGVDL
jgi:SAM-dependent methyltransferase